MLAESLGAMFLFWDASCDGYERSSAHIPGSYVKLALCAQRIRIGILLLIFFHLVLLLL